MTDHSTYNHHGKNVPLWTTVVTAPDGKQYRVSTVEFGDEETKTVIDVLPSGERVKQIHHLDGSVAAAHRAVVEGIADASIDMHVDVLLVWPGRHGQDMHDELWTTINQAVVSGVSTSGKENSDLTDELTAAVLDLVMLLTVPHPHLTERVRVRDGRPPYRAGVAA
jgi:hypothetical protein